VFRPAWMVKVAPELVIPGNLVCGVDRGGRRSGQNPAGNPVQPDDHVGRSARGGVVVCPTRHHNLAPVDALHRGARSNGCADVDGAAAEGHIGTPGHAQDGRADLVTTCPRRDGRLVTVRPDDVQTRVDVRTRDVRAHQRRPAVDGDPHGARSQLSVGIHRPPGDGDVRAVPGGPDGVQSADLAYHRLRRDRGRDHRRTTGSAFGKADDAGARPRCPASLLPKFVSQRVLGGWARVAGQSGAADTSPRSEIELVRTVITIAGIDRIIPAGLAGTELGPIAGRRFGVGRTGRSEQNSYSGKQDDSCSNRAVSPKSGSDPGSPRHSGLCRQLIVQLCQVNSLSVSCRRSDALTLLRNGKRPAGPLRVRYLKEIEKLQSANRNFTSAVNNNRGISTGPPTIRQNAQSTATSPHFSPLRRHAIDKASPSRMSCSETVISSAHAGPIRRLTNLTRIERISAPAPMTSTRPGCMYGSAAR